MKKNSSFLDRCDSAIDNKIFAYFLIILGVLILLFPLLFGNVLRMADMNYIFNPYHAYTYDGFKEGGFSLWNPSIFAGTPLVSNTYPSMFYPLQILFFLGDSYHFWENFLLFFHLLLFIASFYLYMRTLRISSSSALFSALLLLFSGVTLFRILHFASFNSISYFPLILLIIEKIVKNFHSRERLMYFSILAALVIGLQFLAGGIQFSVYIFYASFLYLFLRVIFRYRLNFLTLKNVFISILILLVVSLGVASIQLFPSFESSLYSTRAVEGDVLAARGSYPPWQLINFIMPGFFGGEQQGYYVGRGNPQDFFISLGVFPILLLILFTLVHKNCLFLKKFLKNTGIPQVSGIPSGLPGTWSLIIVFTLLFAFGKYTPLFRIFLLFPGISTFQYPPKIFFITVIGLLTLSALGLDILRECLRQKNKSLSYLLNFFSLFFLAAIFSALLFFLLKKHVFNLGKAYLLEEVINMPGHPFNTGYYLMKLNSVINGITTEMFLLSFFIGASLLFLWLAVHKKIKYPVFFILILVLSLLNLGIYTLPFNKYTSSAIYTNTPDFISYLQQDNSLFRISIDEGTIPPNEVMRYRLQTIQGVDSFILMNYKAFYTTLVLNNASLPDDLTQSLSYPLQNRKALDFLNVKYILSPNEINSTDLMLVFQSKINDSYRVLPDDKSTIMAYSHSVKVYQNPDVFERAFFAKRVVGLSNRDILLQEMKNADDFTTAFVLSPGKEGMDSYNCISLPQITAYTEDYVQIETNDPKDCFLVLTDAYFPGWTATINGIEVPVKNTDYAFRGVDVPAGKNVIEFKFASHTPLFGLLISVATLLAVLLYFLYPFPK